MVYKVIIVDDHKIFRDGFKLALEAVDNAELIGEAANGDQLLEILKHKQPDIVFVDVNMPVLNGYDTVISSLLLYKNIKFIALTSFNDIDTIKSMIHAGVEGYMLKNSEIGDIEKAIFNVMNGKNFFSEEVIFHLTKNSFNEIRPLKEKNANNDLSVRELDVLDLICKGFAVNEIADKLNISVRTVEKHKENLMLKSDTKNTVNLVLWALRNHVVYI